MNAPKPQVWATIAEQAGWLRRALLAVVARDSLRPFWAAAAIWAAVPALVLVLFAGGLLGRVWPTNMDGDALLSLPPPPAITEAERGELARIAPEFRDGLPLPPLQAWDASAVPTTGMFAVRGSVARSNLAAAIDQIQQAANSDDPRGEPDRSALNAARGYLEAVERAEGKDRSAVLYHTALIAILNREPAQAAIAPLNSALDIIKRDLSRNTSDAAERRAAGVRSGIYYALGVVEFRRDRPAAAQPHFEQAIGQALQARAFMDQRSRLFQLDPRTAVTSFDSSHFYAARLIAEQRSGNVAGLSATLKELSDEPSHRWRGRTHLAVTAQLAAADRGLFNRVQTIQPVWSDGDPPRWRDLSEQARYVAGEPMAPPPVAALKPWATIRATRALLLDSPTLNGFTDALDPQSFREQSDMLKQWRAETVTAIGAALLKDGLGGSANSAQRFIISAERVFPWEVVWEASGRRFFFGIPGVWRAVGATVLFLLALYPILVLYGVRTSYRLTFHNTHAKDRAARRLPRAIEAANQAEAAASVGAERL